MEARVLDFGCGYGRVANALSELGYANVVGVDFSERMIERGRRSYPQLDLRCLAGLPAAEGDATYDAALLFAVLTCVPDDEDLRAVLGELRRLIRPGGLLYVSDLPLQEDARNRRRYADGQRRFGTYGVFETEDGAVVRHFEDVALDDLLAGFEMLSKERIGVVTMNGHAASAIQLIARRL
jgi:SAM-dependent methyltransferase